MYRFGEALSEPVRITSLSDWVSNIALFTPLGYLLTAALAVDRPRVGFVVGVAVVVGCALFSASIEFLQLFFPPRVTSLNDIVAETIGSAFGATAWLAVGRPLTEWVRRDAFGLASGVFPAELLPGCILLVAVVQFLPLDFSLQPGALYHKFRDGKVGLVSPHPWPGVAQVAYRQLSNHFMFVPIGVLLAGLRGSRWQDWSDWRRVVGLAVLVVGPIKLVQLFVLSRNSVALDVISGVSAIVLGWAVGVAVRRASPTGRGSAWGVALLAWAGVVVYLNWYPFDFSLTLELAIDRLQKVSLLPFADYVSGYYLNALDQLVSKLALYVPAGLILPHVFGWRTNLTGGIRVVLAVALWAIFIEIGQAFLPNRYPSLTDVLIETLGAWFGFLCATRLRGRATARTFST
jgi:VanZ family protein